MRQALEMALEALEKIAMVNAMDYEYQQWAKEYLAAIKEALAQPEQEPVAWYIREKDSATTDGCWAEKNLDICEPLYTTPPQRKPLTDEQIIKKLLDAGFERNSLGWTFTYGRLDYQLLKFAKSIEAAHGIKGD